MQAVGQIDALQGGGRLWVDALIVQIVDDFFDVERVALRPLDDLVEQRRRNFARFVELLRQLELDEGGGFFRRELAERDLGHLRDPRRERRTVKHEDQYGQIGEIAREMLEQFERKRVDPVDVFEQEQQRRFTERRFAAAQNSRAAARAPDRHASALRACA